MLSAAQDEKSPVILGVSEASDGYMGGLGAVPAMVLGVTEACGITVPVSLHLDHGNYGAAER